MSTPTTVALVTLGCARNDVDSEELAGRLETDGFELVADPEAAELVLVNTCGFIDAAKKDSVDTLLAAAELKTTEQAATKAVVAVGCMAERYGDEVAAALPEADAILSFDDYPNIAARLRSVLAGETQVTHQPQDRRKLLPISPVARQPEPILQVNGPASGPSLFRKRLDSAPTAPLKLANGCDRRCTFCAIPRFRGAFVSRPAAELLAEAIWLAENGVKELFLVSENSTSYGKDLGDLTALEKLLPELAEVSGIERVRVSYLQPAETRPSLIKAIASTPGVTPYFDWSFQHAATNVLRRMRRFGDPDSFLKLLATARELSPAAGARSNFIVGFPGETDAEYEILRDFIIAAELDAVGVFGYSDEENTEAVALPGKLSEAEIADRVADLVAVADEISAQKAASRIGKTVQVLLEAPGEGRAVHQGPEVDGITYLAGNYQIGDLVTATVVDSDGVDLIAEAIQ